MILLSIVIPCFNEADNIFPLFQKIEEILQKDNSIEFVIVDNGSTDNTLNNIISTNLYKEKRIELLKIQNNIGYGHGIMSGVNIVTIYWVVSCRFANRTNGCA